MNRFLFLFIVQINFFVFTQTSERYNSVYEKYYRAEKLFQKEQFGAARSEFREFVNDFTDYNNPIYVKALYYEGLSALALYNNDAIILLQDFNLRYPENIFKKEIWFKLGQYYYSKKKHKQALVWFNKLDPQDFNYKEKEELLFKKGYSFFKEGEPELARSCFYDIKDGETQYADPSLYYYSHIAYQNKKYQLALNGFLKLEQSEKFSSVVPYYIAQIYYLQKKYEEVGQYTSNFVGDKNIFNKKDLNYLIGDAFYRIKKYDEATPYLERHNKSSETTRAEDYCLGYSYFKAGLYEKAITVFDKIKGKKDSLGQVVYYHIAEACLKINKIESARSAFQGAASTNLNIDVQEDALYNYAILSYELDINPYNEAVEAFELYLKEFPNSKRNEDIYQYLVSVYMNTNNYDKALSSLDNLLNKDVRLKSVHQQVCFNKGVSLFLSSSFSAAISSFDLVQKYPVDQGVLAKSLFWKADANYRMKNYDKAIKQYKLFLLSKSLKILDLHQEAKYNIGYAYLKKEEQRKSIEFFRLYIQSNPENKKKKADALMRIADAYYVLKENSQAIKYYKKVLELNQEGADQAFFYLGKTYGYTGQPEKKIKEMSEVINNHKRSKYLKSSIYEVAETYKSEGKLLKSLNYYNKIINDYPNSSLVLSARINVADIYFKQGENNKAETEYLSLLEGFSLQGDVCEKSVRGLVDIYKTEKKLEKIEQLVSQYECANITSIEQEDMYYLPAMEKYEDSSYQESLELFKKYLERFSSGRYSHEVKIYLANSHYALKNFDEAVHIYKKSLEGENNIFTEISTARVSQYLYNEGLYEEAIPYYEKLELVSSTPEIIASAKIGLMRSCFLTKKWHKTIVHSENVLKNTNLNKSIEIEANYALGIARYKTEDYDKAKPPLVWVVENTTTEKSAESRYILAEIFFTQSFYKESNEEITSLIKQKPSYNYWIAKGLMLRSKVLIFQEDLFQSEENLKSIIDHYPVSDDGILDEANELWRELMQIKEEEKEIIKEDGLEVEISDE